MEFSPRFVTLTSIKFRIFLSGQIFLTHQFVSQFFQHWDKIFKNELLYRVVLEFAYLGKLLTFYNDDVIKFSYVCTLYLALELLSLINIAKLANSTGRTCFGYVINSQIVVPTRVRNHDRNRARFARFSRQFFRIINYF